MHSQKSSIGWLRNKDSGISCICLNSFMNLDEHMLSTLTVAASRASFVCLIEIFATLIVSNKNYLCCP